MTELSGSHGFTPHAKTSLSKRRTIAIELIATLALTVSLVVAATAVSLGNRSLARGDVPFEHPAVPIATSHR